MTLQANLKAASDTTTTASASWRDHEVTIFSGVFDSKKMVVKPYSTRTLGDIFATQEPTKKPKLMPPTFIPSSYHEADARHGKAQQEKGSYVSLPGEIDEGDHSIGEIVELVSEFAGPGTAIKVYSTASAKPDFKKWRFLVPLNTPVNFEAWHGLQWALVKFMDANGVKLDTKLTQAAQPVFLPNVPFENRDDNGAPIFHQQHTVDGEGFVLEGNAVAEEWLAASEAARLEAKEAADKAHAAAQIKTEKREAAGMNSVMDQFNKSHDVEELLEQYGYKPGQSNHWRSPMQGSSTYGTMVRGQRWISLSGSDSDAGIGKMTRTGNCSGDAFDLFVYFEHKGIVKDALKALTALSPRPVAKVAAAVRAPATTVNAVDEGMDESIEAVEEELLAPHLSEIALAEVFATEAAGKFRWTPGLDWMHNAGPNWIKDEKMQRYMMAKAICKDAAGQTDKALQQIKVASASTTNAVLKMAQSEPGIVTDISEWDKDQMVLNTPGQAYALSTGLPISREGLIFRQVTGVAPSTMATPVWDKFISEVFSGDLEVVEFIQRLCGYSLTGSTIEHKLFYLHGTGANGKSVFLDVIRSIAGSYAHNLPSEALMTSKHERHPQTFAALHGKRLAVSSEIEDGAHWAEAKIKELTGDGKMTAHFMRQDDFTFDVTHKHILAGNFKPRLRGGDPAIIRRFVLVGFNQTFLGIRQDARLGEKLRAEYPGILNWFIQGASKWAESGLKIPTAVEDASKAYMAEQDDTALWLEECCMLHSSFEETAADLYTSFRSWKEAQGEQPPSKRRWADAMTTAKTEKPILRVKRLSFSRDRGYTGISLISGGGNSSSSTNTKPNMRTQTQ